MPCKKKSLDKIGAYMVVANAQRKTQKSFKRKEKNVYFCKECNAWHTTSQSRKKKSKLIMTNKELELLEIAKNIIKLNEGNIKMGLTGSLMLALNGINKRREANDIDIVCDILCEKEPGYPILPAGFKRDFMSGEKSAVDVFRFIKDDIKIDFLYSEEKIMEVKGVNCGELKLLLNAKKSFSENDKGDESRMKHQLDIEYILKNNDIKL
jgi:hypothetical protein